jgi:hypothetical protein
MAARMQSQARKEQEGGFTMRFLPAQFHGIDYLIGLFVLASPWLFGFVDTTGPWLHVLIGLIIVAAAAMTDFELGVVRVIPMSMHLMLDAVIGIVAIVSPWLFGVQAYAGLHIVLGLFELGAAVTTSTRTAGRAIRA